MPGCSVSVVAYNSGEYIESCVRALASQQCEIVVVDNASQDNTVSRVKALAGQVPVQLVTISRNLGFAAGVNHGARAAQGKVLLVLNPDAIAQPHAIEAVLSCLQESGAEVVGGALLDASGQPARGFAFRRLPTLGSLLCEVLLVNQIWPRNPVNRHYRCLDADYAKAQEVEQPAGACLAVRREAWERLGGMDVSFFPVWFEDVDFCARLRSAGGKIWYCPAARFRHSGAHSVGTLRFIDKQTFWYSNMLRYVEKHFAAWKVVALRAGVVVGMAMRILAFLLGGKPEGVSVATAMCAYAHVAVQALRPLETKTP